MLAGTNSYCQVNLCGFLLYTAATYRRLHIVASIVARQAACYVDYELCRWIGGKGAFGAVDAVSGDQIGALVRSVRPEGTVLLYGTLHSFTTTVSPWQWAERERQGELLHSCSQPG